MKLYLLLQFNGLTGLHIYTLLVELKSLSRYTRTNFLFQEKNATER